MDRGFNHFTQLDLNMKKEIILDSDGVLADFVSATLKLHNRTESHDDVGHWNYYREWGMTDEEFWDVLRGWEFWHNIEPYPWAQELYSELSKLGRVTIVTSPSNDPFASAGKQMWFKTHFNLKPKNVFVGGRKELMANPNAILVDDFIDNINLFKKHGGLTVMFPQPWNEAEGTYKDVIERVAALV